MFSKTSPFSEKQRANSNQNQPPSVPDPNNNKSGSLTTTPVKANGKRIRNGESPISIAKFPLKGEPFNLHSFVGTLVAFGKISAIGPDLKLI